MEKYYFFTLIAAAFVLTAVFQNLVMLGLTVVATAGALTYYALSFKEQRHENDGPNYTKDIKEIKDDISALKLARGLKR